MASEGGRSEFGGGFGGGGMGGEFGAMGGTEEVAIFERQPTVVPVVIQGTIYIFNKPDASKLQPEGAAEDAAMSTASATTP